MLTKTLITAGVMIAALLSASSGSASRESLRSLQSATDVSFSESYQADHGELRQEFHQTYPFSPTGRVSVENLNGEVKIGVWDRNDVQVDAVKRAYKQERLDEAKIEVNAGTEAIRIRTDYPDWDQRFTDDERGRSNNPAIVDYSITVPRKARLESIDLVNGSVEINGVEGDVKASSVNGRVIARGLLGITKLSTVNGGLEATFVSLDAGRTVSLNSVNGPVTMVVPSDVNAIVRASTVHGSISNDFGVQVHHGDYVGHELYGQIGQGGANIKLNNVNGPIRIKHAQDGRALSPATGLITEKEKYKEKNKGYDESEGENQDERLSPEERREAAAARRAERDAHMNAEKMQRETQAEVQREVERAIREAQREIERAQREVERETRREERNEQRREVNEGRGAGRGVGRGRGEGNEYTEKESKTFTVSGTPNVNLSTFDGSITIRGWDKSEVMYTATKRANDADKARQIKIDSQQQGSSISIVARSYEDEGAASLEVYVPRNSTLHVSSGDGSLNLDGVSGELDLRTGDGSIEVSGARGQLRVNTGDGSISVSDFDGNVDARTGDGSISLDGRFTALAARTGDGSISLAVPANSDFTIETDAEDVDNSGLTLSEDIATSKRMRRWKVGRGGNVFLLSTGDGRVALRSR
ncbi:MAG TPA: DUF4097 family beta strand repeat-containing protein [Pyrinomonadaceae bacterium]|nr:DUF4097 family beta strand repeat-containing protein [Pyrinomonadaceae bacterium]